MPENATERKAPQQMSFERGFLPDTGNLDDAKLTGSLRSYMDKGDTAFANDPGRQAVIEGVRNHILKSMRDLNTASKSEAEGMGRVHDTYTKESMMPIVNRLRKAKRKAVLATGEYQLALTRLGGQAGSNARDEIGRMQSAAVSGMNNAGDQLMRQNNPQNPIPAAVPDAVGDDALPGAALPGAVPAPAIPSAVPPPADAIPPAGPLNEDNDLSEGDYDSDFERDEDDPELFDAAFAGLGNMVDAGVHENSAEALKKRTKDTAKLTRLKEKADAYASGKRWRGIFRQKRADDARKDMDDANAAVDREKNTLQQNLHDCAERWRRKRQAYREGSFRERYRLYDQLALEYYRYTRDPNSDRILGQLDPNRIAGGGDASKNIAEYIGVYDESNFGRIGAELERNPYATVEFRKEKEKDLSSESLNTMDEGALLKFHKTIVMEAYAGQITGLREEQEAAEASNDATRVRMKLLNDYRGYKAKKQYSDNTRSSLTDQGETAAARGKMTATALQNARQQQQAIGTEAALMNLVADEKGANGEFLVSEQSAKIYEVRSKGETRRGFFDGSMFISDDMNAAKPILDREKLSKLNYEEGLRQTIRRSDFFNHVNAGTIQHYMTYEANEEFNSAGSEARLQGLASDQNPSLTYRAYMKAERYKQGRGDIDGVKNAVIAAGSTESQDKIRHLGVYLLSDDDRPEFWECARQLALYYPGKFKSGGRFSHRLEHIPDSGQVMRIALMEEFARDRSFFQASTLLNLKEAIRPDNLNMHIEDLSAKRDRFLSWTNVRQSFWDGSMFKAVAGTMSAASYFGGTVSSPENAFSKFTEDYAILSERAEDIPGAALSPIAAIALPSVNAATGFYQAAPIGQTVESAAAVVLDCIKLWHLIHSNEGESEGEREALFGHLILKVLFDIIDLFESIWAIFEETVPEAVWQSCEIIRDVLAMIKDLCVLIRSGIERSKITAGREQIETAMSDRRQNPNDQSVKGQMGLAAGQNYQGLRFLELSREKNVSAQIGAGFDMGANGLSAVGFATGGVTNPVGFGFRLAGKVASFIGWCVTKGYDEHNFNKNIAEILGDERWAPDSMGDYGDMFNETLKRETGIQNMHYLMDLSRIFMAIDTHHLVHHAQGDGETALALNLMRPYLDMVEHGAESDIYQDDATRRTNAARLQNVSLRKVLTAVGAPGNWRAVLRRSITG